MAKTVNAMCVVSEFAVILARSVSARSHLERIAARRLSDTV